MVAIRSTLVCVIVAAILLSLGMRAMTSAIIAADKLLLGGGDFWRESLMPAFLFGIFGVLFGCGVGWRISSTVSLDGNVAWIIGALGVLLLVAVGGVSALIFFQPSIPTLCWMYLGVMAVSALAGLRALTNWLS